MTRTFKYLAGIALISILIVSAISFHAQSVRAVQNNYDVRSTNSSNPLSTTTRAYINSGGTGTTTLSLYTVASDQVDFNFLVKSSTTPAQANWRYEYSENAVDWFSDDIALNSSATSTQHVRTFADHNWLVATSTGGSSNTTDSFKHAQLLNVNSTYTRVVFYATPGSGAFDLWIQARQKGNNPI